MADCGGKQFVAVAAIPLAVAVDLVATLFA
jgi:hypothetical protein